MNDLKDLTKDELIEFLRDGALNWLAHDGLWFRAAEDRFGMEAAMDLDREAWRGFSAIEAKRIMKRLGMAPGGGIPALVRALGYRLYARINEQEVVEEGPMHCVFRMKTCRVQDARKKQGLADFPCKSVGIVEYGEFARTIDERIETVCLSCPPDPKPAEAWCVWEFRLKG